MKTTNNPAQWDQLGGFATLQADAANEALALLDARLATASTFADRVAAFESAYWELADWRYQVALEGLWTRTPFPEILRTPIGDKNSPYVLSPDLGGREEGSPAHRIVSKMQRIALDRFRGSENRVQNVVVLPDGRSVNGNVLSRSRNLPGMDVDPVIAATALPADREILRRAAFEQLAVLETKRAETGGLDPEDPENRQAFANSALFSYQAPEFPRGTDGTLRTWLVASHARVFQVAAILPQAIDLDAMVRGQEGFNRVIHADLRLIKPAGHQSDLGERSRGQQPATRRGPSELGR